MADLEKDIEIGRGINEMKSTAGWQTLEKKIREEIKAETDQIRSFEIEKKGLQEIAAEYLQHREKMNGLERIFEIIQEFLTAKEEAEDKLRK
jgi:hypothetical protein